MVEQEDYVKTVQPHSHADRHESGGEDEINLAGLTGLPQFVDRGDPDAYDFDKNDLTTDENWHDLDLSPIVPEGTSIVWLHGYMKTTDAPRWFEVRKKGNTNIVNAPHTSTYLADTTFYFDFKVSCDEDRFIQYRGSNVLFTLLSIVIVNWYIP